MSRSAVSSFSLVFLAGLVVLFLRNPDPVLQPALYTEDAKWMSDLLVGETLRAYLHARADYLVLGQILLLDLAARTNLVLTGGTVAYLPQTLALLSYAFWSWTAGLIYVSLRPWLPIQWRVFAVIAILLMPMGDHANEILGRISNLGYLFLPLSFALVLIRHDNTNRAISAACVVGLVLCLFTNPICALVIAGDVALRAALRWNGARRLRYYGDAVLVAAGAAFTALYIYRLGAGPVVPEVDNDPARLIEMVGGRSFLYPFVSGFYGALSDWLVLALIAGFGAVAVYALVRSSPRHRALGLALGLAWMIATLIVTVTRPWLSGFLSGYGITFPDRYYLAQNVFAIMLVAWVASRFPRTVQHAALALLMGCMLAGVSRVFEFGGPRLRIATEAPFDEQILQAAARHKASHPGDDVTVAAYPTGMSVTMPAQLLQATAAKLDDPVERGPADVVSLGFLPIQWGVAAAEADGEAPNVLIDGPNPVHSNDLARDGAFVRSTGADPYLVYAVDLTGAAPADLPFFTFDLDCSDRARFLDLRVWWRESANEPFSAENSVHLIAGPGRNVVPLAAHPQWARTPAVTEIRVDIERPWACSSFRLDALRITGRADLSGGD